MDLEPGKTYSFIGWPESLQGRKALALSSRDGLAWVRWANGTKSLKQGKDFEGPVTAIRPGVEEACLLCGGAKEVAVFEQDPDRAWVRYRVGAEACPNCAGS